MGPAQGGPAGCPTARAEWVQHPWGAGQEVTLRGLPSVGLRVPAVTLPSSPQSCPRC